MIVVEIERGLAEIEDQSTAIVRRVRADVSKWILNWPGRVVIDAALEVVDSRRWVAYELVYHHREASSLLDEALVLRFAGDLGSWGDVDAFCRYIAGPAWRRGQLDDDTVFAWATSPDRWWRRAALVATVPLNLRAAGGSGDRDRTIAVCARLVDDRDDMVVKALSWALRELVIWDRAAVEQFLDEHDAFLAARVRREVTNKLDTGLKDPPSSD